MKVKYQFELTMNGFRDSESKYEELCHTLRGLKSEIATLRHLPYLQTKEEAKFKDYLESFSNENLDLSSLENLSHTITHKKKTLTLKTFKAEFDDSYGDSGLVECIHSGLRKHCESKASWGLWQNINYSVDQKKVEGLNVFWSNFAYLWRLVSKKYPKLHKLKQDQINKIAVEFRKIHFEEMSEDQRVHELVKDNDSRALWYMLLGLYDSLPAEEMGNLIYALSESEVK